MRKRFLYLSLSALLISAGAYAQEWQSLGGKIASNDGKRLRVVPASDGSVYAVYNNVMNASLINVLKYDGKTWKPVGGKDFSSGPAQGISMQTDRKGVPYVAYSDGKKGNKAIVQKFNGNAWEQVGPAEVTVGTVNGTSLAFDNNNIPYLAVTDQKRERVAVFKFESNNWTELPTAVEGTGDYVTIAFAKNNELYISCSDTRNGQKAVVKKFDGTKWDNVGTFVSAKSAKYTSFALDGKDVPYVVYQDNFNNNTVLAKKFNAAKSQWETIGDPVFASSYNDNVSFAVSASGVPFVGFHNSSNFEHKVDIRKFDGTKWVTAGTAGNGADGYFLMQGSGNDIYACFNESNNGAVVKKITL